MAPEKHEIVTLLEMIFLTLATMLCTASLCGQDTPSDTPNFGCIERLAIPNYTIFSRSARLTGTAETIVLLDSSGKISKTTVTGVSDILMKEVMEKMSESVFSAHCGGKAVRLVFVYELEGQEKYGIGPSEISFTQPNRFVIRSSPPLMLVD